MAENQFRIGLVRVERAVRERLSLSETEDLMPQELINAKPVSAVVKEFFGSSPALAGSWTRTTRSRRVTHKRRISALGPGGLTRERAGFEVPRRPPRPITGGCAPSRPRRAEHRGSSTQLAVYARTNEYGFIETPYRKVENGRVTDETRVSVRDRGGSVRHLPRPNASLDEEGAVHGTTLVTSRHRNEFTLSPPSQVQYMDVSPRQIRLGRGGAHPLSGAQ